MLAAAAESDRPSEADPEREARPSDIARRPRKSDNDMTKPKAMQRRTGKVARPRGVDRSASARTKSADGVAATPRPRGPG